jgi:hypothetical protein
MLIYNPAFDLHHTVFRLLQLLSAAPAAEYETERVRILDYFLLFPEQIQSLKFPDELRRKRAWFVQPYNPYRSIDNPSRLFFQLEPIQTTALQSLASRSLIDRDRFKAGLVARTAEPLPPALAEAVKARSAAAPELIDLVSRDLAALPLLGPKGLKERSRLLDTRYDEA